MGPDSAEPCEKKRRSKEGRRESQIKRSERERVDKRGIPKGQGTKMVGLYRERQLVEG